MKIFPRLVMRSQPTRRNWTRKITQNGSEMASITTGTVLMMITMPSTTRKAGDQLRGFTSQSKKKGKSRDLPLRMINLTRGQQFLIKFLERRGRARTAGAGRGVRSRSTERWRPSGGGTRNSRNRESGEKGRSCRSTKRSCRRFTETNRARKIPKILQTLPRECLLRRGRTEAELPTPRQSQTESRHQPPSLRARPTDVKLSLILIRKSNRQILTSYFSYLQIQMNFVISVLCF